MKRRFKGRTYDLELEKRNAEIFLGRYNKPAFTKRNVYTIKGTPKAYKYIIYKNTLVRVDKALSGLPYEYRYTGGDMDVVIDKNWRKNTY